MASSTQKSATLIFPHQLFKNHPAISKKREIYLIEDTLFFGDPHAAPGKFHKQKIILHRASMKAYEQMLKDKGYKVNYINYDREKTIDKLIPELQKTNGYDEFHVSGYHDFLLEKRIKRSGAKVTVHDCPMFVTPTDWADEHFDNRKKPFMAAFYEAQRKRMDILIVDGDQPVGGQWSYDEDNRKPMPRRGGLDVPPPPEARSNDYIKEAKKYVEKHYADYPGDVELFSYPITHKDSEKWMNKFFNERFEKFGPYEDAVSQKERTLFHSLLTPMLNVGLLTPQQVVDTALDFAEEHDTPLNSLEGFIRQVIGWREFMYTMYRRHGVEMRNRNFFNHSRSLPEAFWTGETGILPIDHTINRVMRHSYCHHIERLMILGNFMLLSGFDPTEVNNWYMELFIDAYDWVMVPNVYGMSQFADGGIFTTKPYISGSNYVKKMSDYPKGEWCDIWDALFWLFIRRERDFFSRQHRLGMMVRTLDKMGDKTLESHERNYEEFFTRLSGTGS